MNKKPEPKTIVIVRDGNKARYVGVVVGENMMNQLEYDKKAFYQEKVGNLFNYEDHFIYLVLGRFSDNDERSIFCEKPPFPHYAIGHKNEYVNACFTRELVLFSFYESFNITEELWVSEQKKIFGFNTLQSEVLFLVFITDSFMRFGDCRIPISIKNRKQKFMIRKLLEQLELAFP